MRTQRFHRVRRATGIAMITGMGLLGLAVTPAQAAACTFNGCSGKDPQVTGCATGARNLSEFTNAWGDRIELRFSSACGAVWTRMKTLHCQYSKPVLETGYIDYYGHYHRQGLFTSTDGLCSDGRLRTGWTPMSSSKRERLKYGSDQPRSEKVTYLTGCNDCYWPEVSRPVAVRGPGEQTSGPGARVVVALGSLVEGA